MIAHFLTGVIVGVLIGLALAPFLRNWILWQSARTWNKHDTSDAFDEPAPRRR